MARLLQLSYLWFRATHGEPNSSTKRHRASQKSRKFSSALQRFLRLTAGVCSTSDQIAAHLRQYVREHCSPVGEDTYLCNSALRDLFGIDQLNLTLCESLLEPHVTAPKRRESDGFNATLKLSDELAVICGSDQLSRPAVVKALWRYIKEHNLQSQHDRRVIVCDDALKMVMGVNEIGMMAMNKVLSKHLQPLNPVS